MKVKTGIPAGDPIAGSFTHSLRALESDRQGAYAGWLLLGALLLGAWVAWCFFARVGLYEVSSSARLEVDQMSHPVAAPVGERVTSTRLAMGETVRAGDVLVELNSALQQLLVKEESTRLAGIGPQLAAEQTAIRGARLTAQVAVDAANAQLQEAEAASRLADDEAARLENLHSAGIISEVDLLRARTESQRRKASVNSLRFAASRLDRDFFAALDPETLRRTYECVVRRAATLVVIAHP